MQETLIMISNSVHPGNKFSSRFHPYFQGIEVWNEPDFKTPFYWRKENSNFCYRGTRKLGCLMFSFSIVAFSSKSRIPSSENASKNSVKKCLDQRKCSYARNMVVLQCQKSIMHETSKISFSNKKLLTQLFKRWTQYYVVQY